MLLALWSAYDFEPVVIGSVGAFQASAFQNNAFQIDGGATQPSVPIPDNRYSYELTKQVRKRRIEEIRRLKLEEKKAQELLLAKENEIKLIEAKRKSDLEDEFLQKRLLKLLKEFDLLKAEQFILQQRLQVYLREEEEILIILNCLL